VAHRRFSRAFFSSSPRPRLIWAVARFFFAVPIHEPFPVELAGHQLGARKDQRAKSAGGAEPPGVLLLCDA
jgi:hypothetical protein